MASRPLLASRMRCRPVHPDAERVLGRHRTLASTPIRARWQLGQQCSPRMASTGSSRTPASSMARAPLPWPRDIPARVGAGPSGDPRPSHRRPDVRRPPRPPVDVVTRARIGCIRHHVGLRSPTLRSLVAGDRVVVPLGARPACARIRKLAVTPVTPMPLRIRTLTPTTAERGGAGWRAPGSGARDGDGDGAASRRWRTRRVSVHTCPKCDRNRPDEAS